MTHEVAETHIVWTRGRAGWQPNSTTVLVVIGFVLATAVIGYAAILFSDPSPAMKAHGIAVSIAGAVGSWTVIAHLAVNRRRVLRVEVEGHSMRFGRGNGSALSLRLLAVAGALLLGTWLWAVLTVPDRMIPIALLLTPVVAALLIYGGLRALLGRGGSALVLEPSGVRLDIPRNVLTAGWQEIEDVERVGNRMVIRTARHASAGWGVRDLASDPVVLGELVAFYAATPAARQEIGPAALKRLRDGDF